MRAWQINIWCVNILFIFYLQHIYIYKSIHIVYWAFILIFSLSLSIQSKFDRWTIINSSHNGKIPIYALFVMRSVCTVHQVIIFVYSLHIMETKNVYSLKEYETTKKKWNERRKKMRHQGIFILFIYVHQKYPYYIVYCRSLRISKWFGVLRALQMHGNFFHF